MSRAYDDVFSRTVLEVDPLLRLGVHLMRDPSFQPHGVALEVEPSGIAHVPIVQPRGSRPVILLWSLDRLSHLHPDEELLAESALYHPPDHLEEALRGSSDEWPWFGRLDPEAVRVQNMRDEIRAVIDARALPDAERWRLTWGYELTVATSALIEDRIEGWVVLESV